MTNDDFEELGLLVDQLDAVTYSAKLPVPAHIHVEGLLGTITDVRDKLKKFVIEKSGENPWDDSP